jgi:hypothetical protein
MDHCEHTLMGSPEIMINDANLSCGYGHTPQQLAAAFERLSSSDLILEVCTSSIPA